MKLFLNPNSSLELGFEALKDSTAMILENLSEPKGSISELSNSFRSNIFCLIPYLLLHHPS